MMAASKSSPPQKRPPRTNHSLRTVFAGDRRNGLGEYLRDPANHPAVLGYNDDFVVIKDLYPKSTIHLLILPRDPIKQHQQMSEACYDDEFLSKLKQEAAKWKTLAAKELACKLCPPTEIIPKRDWEAEIKVGIHAVPSMNHLHIHIISKDMHSSCLRQKKHYNSFTTPFFVDLQDFPLTEEEAEVRRKDWHKRDMICWRCNRNFENKFTALKHHLDKEFEEWRAELIQSVQEERAAH